MDFIKTLQFILDNPANNLNQTSKELIETMINNLKTEQSKTIHTNFAEQIVQPFKDPRGLACCSRCGDYINKAGSTVYMLCWMCLEDRY